MPDNPLPDVPDSASGVLWAIVIAGAFFMRSVFNRILNAAISKRSTKIDKMEQDIEDVRREQRRESRRIDRVESYIPGMVRLTRDEEDG